MKLFLKYNNCALALKAGVNLLKFSPSYCKTERAVSMLNEYLKTVKQDGPVELEEFKQLAASWKKSPLNPKNMVDALEMIKLDPKNAKAAVEGLESDPLKFAKLRIAEKTLRKLRKVDSKVADDYLKLGQTVFSYSTAFEGANSK